jgi:hypothetical protein
VLVVSEVCAKGYGAGRGRERSARGRTGTGGPICIPGATVGVAAAMQGQADRLCSVVPEPVVLPAPTQRAVAPLAFC